MRWALHVAYIGAMRNMFTDKDGKNVKDQHMFPEA